MTAALTLTDVTLLHGDGEETVRALDQVDLDVAAGELVAVVGPSGSGKSSLLAVAGALASPTSGTVRLGDDDLGEASPRDLARIRRERIGFVFQSGNLVPALTSLDQVRLPLTFGRFIDPRDPLDLLTRVGMEPKARRRPHQLSGGERQRVGIARAGVGLRRGQRRPLRQLRAGRRPGPHPDRGPPGAPGPDEGLPRPAPATPAPGLGRPRRTRA
jgi:putative ABC transport system ATP-binding protein